MEERPILSVSQVNIYIKNVLDNDLLLSDVTVKGEISNYKLHSSGHIYMSLKDETGVMRAVMFRGAASKLRFRPENGMKVIARGRVTVYERDGQYQLYINSMEQEGVGDLHVAFEELKKKLMEEGLFDSSKKKPLPKYPKKVGVVTAPTGAAIRDIINVITRRFPKCEIVIYPSLVQGPGAAANVAEGIRYFNETGEVDTIIAGRGGGSIEDLWAFNEEIVARAVFDSKIPIISAVGHETDFTICDFVADLRAPTPSAAAELAVPDYTELLAKLTTYRTRIINSVLGLIKTKRALISRLSVSTPKRVIDEHRQKIDFLFTKMEKAVMLSTSKKREQFSKACAKLDAMSPLSVLSRGYSVAEADGKMIKSASSLNSGDDFTLRFTDGNVDCRVK